jgi:hypothetical protein
VEKQVHGIAHLSRFAVAVDIASGDTLPSTRILISP